MIQLGLHGIRKSNIGESYILYLSRRMVKEKQQLMTEPLLPWWDMGEFIESGFFSRQLVNTAF
jgi:hypothetical protein